MNWTKFEKQCHIPCDPGVQEWTFNLEKAIYHISFQFFYFN